MNKAGKITDREAASLIEEVLRGESGPPPTINRVTEGMAGVGSSSADAQGNVIQLSHFDFPTGQAGSFRGNRIRMSKVAANSDWRSRK